MKNAFLFLLLVAFSTIHVLAQAPNITYSGVAATYPTGTAISALTPSNTGGAVVGTYGAVTTFAGSGIVGSTNGTGTAARFYGPAGVAVDASGNVYVADFFNNRIRKITALGEVSTFAGSGNYEFADGTGTAASFYGPFGVAVDASGNVFVADRDNNRIRKITPAGEVTTFAGNGTAGFADGTGTAARFSSPYGVVVDASGNVYVADAGNNRIRKITALGEVTTLAGSGTIGFADGTGPAARFSSPYGVAVDASGNVYVADTYNNRIRKITSAGVVTTLAGSGTTGSTNGTGTAASLSLPSGVAVDASGNVYVAERDNHLIRKITSAGVVTTLAGSTEGFANGTGTAASFKLPSGVTLDASGNMYVADFHNQRIRKVDLTGYSIAPALPVGLSINPATGVISGTPTAVTASATYTVTATNAGGSATATVTFGVVAPPSITYSGVAATYPTNAAISALTPTNTGGAVVGTYGAVTTLAGSGTGTFADGTGTAASFHFPLGAAVDATGNVYVADRFNNRIRKITSAGEVTTLAGSGNAGITDGTGTAASFNFPTGVAVDASGNVYVADRDNNRIRKITSAGEVTTLAGSGTFAFADGTGTAASFNQPLGVAVDASGNVYVADRDNNRIRKITSAGEVTTLAGSGTFAFADGTGTAASFNQPLGVAVDASGNVFVADRSNHRIRKITAAGVVTTLAGSGSAGFADGIGTAASFNLPTGVAADASGNVYVVDQGNQSIRKITAAGVVTTLAGSGTAAFANGTGTAASFNSPIGVAVDASGNVYVADQGNHRIRKVDLTGYSIAPALPAGLSINPATGVISGTPTAVTASATYTVTATNAGGSATATVTFGVVNPCTPPTVSVGANVTVTCTSPSTTLTATGGGTYAWSGGATQGGTVNPAVTTTYTVTVTATDGCTATASKTVTVDKTAPTASAGGGVTVTCTTPSTTLTATGGGTYAWGNELTQGSAVSPTATTTYTVTVTGTNGCTATASKTVTVDKTPPTASAGAAVTLTCTTPSTTLIATGGGTYAWSGGATQGGIVSPAVTTTYIVTVTATNGCTATASKVVTIAPSTACAAPTITPNVAVSGSNATFSWTAGCYTKYRIQYRKTTSPSTASWATKLINAPATSTVIAHPSAGTYRWGMVAGCSGISQFSTLSSGSNYTVGGVAPLMLANQGATVTANVFPNPAKNQLNVSVQPETPGTCLVRMYDAMGRVLVTKSFFAEGETTVQWQVDELINGIYYVQIVLAGQDPITKSVFIAH